MQRRGKEKGRQHPNYSQNWVKTSPFPPSIGLGYMQGRYFCKSFRRTSGGSRGSLGCPLSKHGLSPICPTSLQVLPAPARSTAALAPASWGKHEEPFDLMKEDGNVAQDLLFLFTFSLFLMQESIKHIRLTTSVSRRDNPRRQNLLIIVSASKVSFASEKKKKKKKQL